MTPSTYRKTGKTFRKMAGALQARPFGEPYTNTEIERAMKRAGVKPDALGETRRRLLDQGFIAPAKGGFLMRPTPAKKKAARKPVPKAHPLAGAFQKKYRNRLLRLERDWTVLRFLPAINPSGFDWVMPLEVYRYLGGPCLTSPTSIDAKAPDPIRNAKNRAGEEGWKLKARRYAIAWAIEPAAPKGQRLKLFCGSLFPEERKNRGLAGELVRETKGKGKDITDPLRGHMVEIQKPDLAQGLGFKLKIQTAVAGDVGTFLAVLTDAEFRLLAPLESTLRIPSGKEMQDALAACIDTKPEPVKPPQTPAPKTPGAPEGHRKAVALVRTQMAELKAGLDKLEELLGGPNRQKK